MNNVKSKFIGEYIKKLDIKSPYLPVEKLKILDEEIKGGSYLIDTGCDYDIAISEIFVSEGTKEMLESSGRGVLESDPSGRKDRMLTYGIITLNENYSKKVFVCIMYHSRLIEGEKIIGIGVINDFLTTLDPFKEEINLTINFAKK